MTMRLQELHPALVHFPITMLPTVLAVDAAGRATGNETLLEAGRVGIALAAAGAGVAAAAGVLAQESSRFDERAMEKLITHRNLNLGLIGLTSLLAVRRSRTDRPSARYLLAGAAGVATMMYSAYLGGNLVYEDGVGVDRAGGLRREDAPELTPDNASEVIDTARRLLVRGLRNALKDLARGAIVPWLIRDRRSEVAGAGPPTRHAAIPEDEGVPML